MRLATYPDECVGLLLGQVAGRNKHIEAIFQVENRWEGQVSLATQLTTPSRAATVSTSIPKTTSKLTVRRGRRGSISLAATIRIPIGLRCLPSATELARRAWAAARAFPS